MHRAARFALLLFVIICTSPAPAVQRAFRVHDENTGLAGSWVQAIGQDSDGYIWLGTVGGVIRFDGERFRNWTDRPPTYLYTAIVTGPAGEVLVIDEAGAILQVAGQTLTSVAGPDGRPLDGVQSAVFGTDGTLWLAREDVLLAHDESGWRAVSLPDGTGTLNRVAPASGGGVYLTTRVGAFRIHADGTAEPIISKAGLLDILELEDGTLAVLQEAPKRDPAVLRIHDGQVDTLLEIPARARALARRGGTLFAAFDRYLAIIVPGASTATIGPDDRLPSGGPLLVDQEGSLWVGTYQGLYQFPEPETLWFGEAEGLPSSHARFVDRTGDDVWVTTWQGLGRLTRTADGWRVRAEWAHTISHGCVDERGTAWVVDSDWLERRFTLLERRPDRDLEHEMEGFRTILSCAAAPDGGLWMASNIGLLKTSSTGGVPRRIPAAPERADGRSLLHDVLEDSAGRLWVSFDRTICHAGAREIADGVGSPWDCEALEGLRHTSGFVEMASGSIWAAAPGGGVLRYEDGGWGLVPASHSLPTREVLEVHPSVSGGVWILGFDLAIRVEEQLDLPGGWKVLERLSAWHGLPVGSRRDVLEEEDGTLWITTMSGAARVPPRARVFPRTPPRVRLTELLQDGRQIVPGPDLVLPYRRNRLEMHFSALSYRDPGLLRYRIRTGEGTEPESQREPSVRFADLSPGYHVVEVTASLDGEHWSPEPARFTFRVASPWYVQAWFLTLCLAAMSALAYGIHRARVGFLLRLERQRARIAMDLHDEMGSGLGSIGILAELVAGDGLAEDRRRSVSSQIVETASDLGAALDDIVWSLRPGAETLEALAADLVERGRRLFPHGRVAFDARFPARWPHVRLSPAMRRTLQRIAVEAMHNAARHASPTRVALGLLPHGRRWRLWVQDDGEGIPADVWNTSDGMGLPGMRKRAEEIGAAISWEPAPGGGTKVLLEFDPGAA